MLLSIVVPIFNEEEIIGGFLKELVRKIDSFHVNYELLLVENGSTDKSLTFLKKAAEKNPSIKVFHLSKPSYGRALKFGLKKTKGDFVVVFNVDFWEPEFLELAVNKDLSKSDILVGSKNLPQSNDRRPFQRKFISKSFMVFLRLFLGFKGSDTHGIKAFRRSVLKDLLPKCKLSSGLFDTELLVRAQRAGFKIKEVPVDVKEVRPPRFRGRFLSTPKDIWELYSTLQE